MDTKALLRRYIDEFNRDDEEAIINEVSNADALEWLEPRIPRIAVPDADIERAYYFRWWTYRKHLRNTPEGHVLSEFNVSITLPWGYKYSAISCAAGHHADEGGWMRENAFLDEYIRFWYRAIPALHSYGNWLDAAVAQLCRRRGDWTLGEDLLDSLVESYRYVEQTQRHDSGAYFSIDDRDGQEYSVAGSGLRPTVSSYMYAGARGIAEIARKCGKVALSDEFEEKAIVLRIIANRLLWDEEARFYKTVPLSGIHAPVPERRPARFDARELCGYVPWQFHMALPGREDAFRQLFDPDGFFGAVAPTTCERRHPDYLVTISGEDFNRWLGRYDAPPYGHPTEEQIAEWRSTRDSGGWLYSLPDGCHIKACTWNGPSWAYSTSCMISAAASAAADYPGQAVTRDEYTLLLHRYAAAHRRVREDGKVVSWIDEAQHPDTGEWLTRRICYDRLRANPEKADFPAGIDRGKDYNHSVYCDLVLSGLFGVRPEPDSDAVRIVPLFPEDWDYAEAEDIPIHGRTLSIRWKRGEGYTVRAGGKDLFSSAVPAACRLETL